jgi:hypothetical protein
VTAASTGEVLPGLWRFEAPHPEWTEPEGGEDGWDEVVAWWALRTGRGLVLVDPLVSDWEPLDRLVSELGGCAAIVRTIYWHQRTVAGAAARYDVGVWAGRAQGDTEVAPPDHAVTDGEELLDGVQGFALERQDELALWLPAQAALLFGDAMLRRDSGELRVCPDSWSQPPGGPGRLRELLGALARLPVEHVLVSHGPLTLGDGRSALEAAL